MDPTPQTTSQRSVYREERIEAQQAANGNATLLAQQQAAAIVAQQQQAAENSAAATILAQQQEAARVAQQQAAVLAAQQQLAAAQAVLVATTPTVPTGQPPTRNIMFVNTAGFALNPEMANQGILDYITTEVRNIYETATRALSTVGYVCDPNGLYQKLDTLSERAHIFWWINPGGIMCIPDSLVTAPTTKRNR